MLTPPQHAAIRRSTKQVEGRGTLMHKPKYFLICQILLAILVSGVLHTAHRTLAAGDPVLVGAGDIADCRDGPPERIHAADTARLLDDIAGTVFTAGDNAYPDGTAANYRDCYEPTWGRHKARTRPAPGNHEYNS